MAYSPIWKDYFVNLGAVDAIPFRIKLGDESGDVIYSGKSYIKPGKTSNIVRVNDILADFIGGGIYNVPPTFVLEAELSGTWTKKMEMGFYNDWSYDDWFSAQTMGLLAPINGHIDARQIIFATSFGGDSIDAIVRYKDGDTEEATMIPGEESWLCQLDMSNFPNAESVLINGHEFKVVTDCAKWGILYTNAYGGTDIFLIEGNFSERDTLTRHNRKVEYDNRITESRGTQNFANELVHSYTFNTSWLSDEESARMHHLLNSTNVSLFNIETTEVIPVVLTATTTEYKTFKGNGGRLVNYQFDAVLAQNRVRR